jgi:hypothetical protein
VHGPGPLSAAARSPDRCSGAHATGPWQEHRVAYHPSDFLAFGPLDVIGGGEP